MLTPFYKTLLKLCAAKDKTPSGVASAIGLSNAAASGWKSGKTPSDTTFAKLSEYFGVSVEYLKGSEKEKSPTPESVEQIPNYEKLNDANKVIVQTMIAQLLAAQSND